MNVAELSKKQRAVLRWIRNVERELSAEGSYDERRALSSVGVPWELRGNLASPVERASVSRTLVRLERRGLIPRQNIRSASSPGGRARDSAEEPHRKTTHVLMTEAGRRAADASRAALRARS
jgi:hypothetical protein